MTKRQYDRWQNRWKGLSDSIQAQIKEITGDDEAVILKRPTTTPTMTASQILAARIAELEEVKAYAQTIEDSSEEQADRHFKAVNYLALNLLLRYTDERFHYFNEGFFGEGKKHKLERSIELPPDYVLHRTLKLASRDFSTITKMYVQRKNEGWRGHLESADYLAELALEPAIAAELVPNAQIITYFQKETSIKIIPYASMALIGIPYASFYNPTDLMSIPHEVGHHVYVNGRYQEDGIKKVLNQELAHQVAEYPYWLRQWIEEIFADVYGAIIAGPIAALSAQMIIGEKSPAERVQDDGEHPVDLVRPLVYQYILNKIYGDAPGSESSEADFAHHDLTQEVIAALEERWESANFGLPKQFRPAISPLGLNEEVPDGFITEKMAKKMLADLINNSERIRPLKKMIAAGDRKRKADKKTREAEAKTQDPEAFFPLGDWGNLQNDKTKGQNASTEPEVMFDKFERLFKKKFELATLGIEEEKDSQKEATLQFDIIREEEPYSTHILYGLNHGPEVQIPAGVWRLLGDDWGEKGPRTISGGGGGGYP